MFIENIFYDLPAINTQISIKFDTYQDKLCKPVLGAALLYKGHIFEQKQALFHYKCYSFIPV